MDATILRYDANGYWIRGGTLAEFLRENLVSDSFLKKWKSDRTLRRQRLATTLAIQSTFRLARSPVKVSATWAFPKGKSVSFGVCAEKDRNREAGKENMISRTPDLRTLE
jgi:hypothetical protein